MAMKNLGASASGTKALSSLAPVPKSSKNITGGDAGPGGKIRTATLHKAPSTNLMASMSSHRGSSMGTKKGM